MRLRAGWIAAAAVLLGLAASAVALDRSAGPGPDRTAEASPTPTTHPETLEEQLARVAETVGEIRELTFDEIPDPVYLDPEQLAERAGAFVEDYTPEEAEVDGRILRTLGAISPDDDLRDLLSGVLEEQVAGFYDPDTGELVVGTNTAGDRLGPLDELTLAHELQHALADQALGLPDIATEQENGDEDAAFAAAALVEGDATVTMSLYAAEKLSLVDRMQILRGDALVAGEMEALAGLPHYLRRSLLFPYEEGATFVADLHARGGWAAVDAAYEQPPASTLEILEPASYPDGAGTDRQPAAVDDPEGWQRHDSMSFGAADLLFLFEAPGDDGDRALDDPMAAVATWRGGEVTLFTADDASAVALSLVGAPGLCASTEEWYARAFPEAETTREASDGATLHIFDGPAQDAVLSCTADKTVRELEQVRLGIASEVAIAQELAGG